MSSEDTNENIPTLVTALVTALVSCRLDAGNAPDRDIFARGIYSPDRIVYVVIIATADTAQPLPAPPNRENRDMDTSIHRSNFGGLLNRSTSALVDAYRRYENRIREIDGIGQFVDAYDFQCARNDRADYAKRLVDLSEEINARLVSPEASARVIRCQIARGRLAIAA